VNELKALILSSPASYRELAVLLVELSFCRGTVFSQRGLAPNSPPKLTTVSRDITQGQGWGKVVMAAGDRLQASSLLNRQFRQFLKGEETVIWISTV